MPQSGTIGIKLAGNQQTKPRRAAILVCSDRAYSGERPDRSGATLRQRLCDLGWQVSQPQILPDDLETIATWLKEKSAGGEYDLLLTSGGTGLAERDVTPEATLRVIQRRVPGLEEAMRAQSAKITPHAMLSRAVAGVAGRTLIVNLPGSERGGLDCRQVIEPALEHSAALLRGEKPDS
ncbi:MAG TPA: MogA/MoaB family molybdenum cofactor biosynthesis protein [bacterium]